MTMRKGVLTTLASQVGIQFIGILTGVLIARFLGPEGRGELTAVIAWATVLTYVGDFGLPVAYTYASARSKERVPQLLGNSLIVTAAQWLLIAVVGTWVLATALAHHGAPIVHLAELYLYLYVPLNLLNRYIAAILQGLGHFTGFNAIRVFVVFSYLVLLAVFFLVMSSSVGMVVSANLLSNALTLVLSFFLILPHLRAARGLPWREWFQPSALRADFKYGLSAHIGNLQPFNSMQLDVLILTTILSAHDLGLYMVGLAASSVLKAQGSALGAVLLPAVAKQTGFPAQRHQVMRYAAVTLLLGCATAAVALIWAPQLVQLIYGSQFMAAAPLVRIMVLSGIAAALYRVLADGLRGLGHPLKSSMAELIGVVVGVPAMLLLVPRLGAAGAAIAVSLASLIALMYTAFGLLRAGFGARDIIHLLRGTTALV